MRRRRPIDFLDAGERERLMGIAGRQDPSRVGEGLEKGLEQAGDGVAKAMKQPAEVDAEPATQEVADKMDELSTMDAMPEAPEDAFEMEMPEEMESPMNRDMLNRRRRRRIMSRYFTA